MTDLAGIAATFSDLKLIRGRKVAQLIFELPVEHAKQALDALGMPAQETWCAIARLNQKPELAGGASSTPEGGIVSRLDAVPPAKPKRKWDELKPSAQAGIRCDDADFAQFLKVKFELSCRDKSPEEAVRYLCRVGSRAELDAGDAGAREWAALDAHYRSWRQRPGAGGGYTL